MLEPVQEPYVMDILNARAAPLCHWVPRGQRRSPRASGPCLRTLTCPPPFFLNAKIRALRGVACML